jgi:AcrR family transcriptional regulator
MPYSKEHTRKTRASIIESARILFNVHGFQSVTIDMVMKRAGLTRGGFYTHFKNKEELFAAAISSFLMGRGAQWRDEAGIDVTQMRAETAEQMISSYLSDAHLGDVEDQCPMIALPSDVARSGDEVKGAYQELLTAMVWLFESSLEAKGQPDRSKALSLAATCVGGMILARTLPDSALAEEVRAAALASALT